MRNLFSGGTTKSYILVFLQFFWLGWFAVTGHLIARHPLWLLLEFFGLGLGLQAILVMRLGHFKVIPEVVEHATLNQRGPYRFIRHPMYSSLLITTAALVMDDPSWLRGFIWLALLITLVTKLSYEESLLLQKFPEYADYIKRTKRLIPFVW